MATTFVYDDLKTKYNGFVYPLAMIKIEGKDFAANDADLAASDIEVEMTSGFEASIATFWIYNSYDQDNFCFRYDEIKSWIYIGSSVTIGLGYDNTVREIFQGFISGVRFVYPDNGTPGVEVTAMDVKGIMMSGSYSRQLTASTYSAAVKEILEKTAYAKLKSGGIISSINITDTPDVSASAEGSSGADRTIEMVCESDYEFVVKAAKKFNYEFFTVGGDVYFRKARSNTDVLIELSPGQGLLSYEIGYDITGLVETVEVRGMDVGKSKAISQTQKLQNKISQGSKAKALLSKSEKVYIDPTIASVKEAGYRADYLAGEISYRFGTLEAELLGLPEMTVGRFIEIKNLGTAASNTFYVVNVRHIMDSQRGYITKVTGKAASMK